MKTSLSIFTGLCFMALPIFATAQETKVELIGVAAIAGNATDQSGFEDRLSDGTPHSQFGGISGIDYDPQTNLFWAASDRGPKDGAVDWICRIHALKIDILPGTSKPASATIQSTVILTDKNRAPLIGASKAIFEVTGNRQRFDPEGIRMAPQGGFYISDEYGPYLFEFRANGHFARAFNVPANLTIANPDSDEITENAQNDSGRQTNRGMEGLATTIDGKQLIGLMQSPLIQDGKMNAKGKFDGLYCRIVAFNLDGNPTRQMVYPLDSQDNKLNEILAVDGSRYLTIERDGELGDDAKFKKIMEIDLSEASDISEVEKLPVDGPLPAQIVPVRKKVFIDLLDPQFGLAGDRFPEKVEGLCWGPALNDGRKTLIVAVDNDFIPENETLIYVFAF